MGSSPSLARPKAPIILGKRAERAVDAMRASAERVTEGPARKMATQFADWLDGFLPDLHRSQPKVLLEPANVSDRSDPQIVR